MTEYQNTTNDTSPTTLAEYYANSRAKPASFFKALRLTKITKFAPEDVESSLKKLPETDPDLSRTVGLAVVAKTPEAVSSWLSEVARSKAQEMTGEMTLGQSAEVAFERIVQTVSDQLLSKEKNARQRAENIVRLIMMWLISHRSLNLLSAIKAIAGGKRFAANNKALRAAAQRSLIQSKPNQWRNLSSIVALSDDAVVTAERLRDEANSTRRALSVRVDDLESKVSSQTQEIDVLKDTVATLEEELRTALADAAAERGLRELDRTEWTSRYRNFLSGRLKLLLSDAKDALEFDPPHIEAVRERIGAATESVNQEMSRLDG